MLEHLSIRPLFGLVLAAAFGWWAHTPPPAAVRAAEFTDMPGFQFSNVAGEGTLSVYMPQDRTIYVYSGVLTGNSNKNCTYALRLQRAGGPVERTNCTVGSLLPNH